MGIDLNWSGYHELGAMSNPGKATGTDDINFPSHVKIYNQLKYQVKKEIARC